MSTARLVQLFLLIPLVIGLERFAHYGLRSSLMLYLIDGAAVEREQAFDAYRWFASALTFSPLIGGLVAILTGPRITMIAGSALIGLGFGALLIPHPSAVTVMMVLMVVGGGLFKPSIYAFAGMEMGRANESSRLALFMLAYLSVNASALLSTFLPTVEELRWTPLFVLLGFAMFLATVGAVLLSFVGQRAPKLRSSGQPELGLLFVAALVLPAVVMLTTSFDIQHRNLIDHERISTSVMMINPIVVTSSCFMATIVLFALSLSKTRVPCLLLLGSGIILSALGSTPLIISTGIGTTIASVVVLSIAEPFVFGMTVARMSSGTHHRFATAVIAVWLTIAGASNYLGMLFEDPDFARILLLVAALLTMVCGALLLLLRRTLENAFFK